jgi:hypothetical protein
MSKSEPADAIALLKEDHRKVEGLFEQFEKARNNGRKLGLARQICTELTVHATLEEEIFYPACKEAVEDDLEHEAYVEHDGAKVLIAEIAQGNLADEFYDAKVTVLAEMIKHHVKEEEKPGEGFFAQARKGDVDMEGLGTQLKARKEQLLAAIQQGGLPPPEIRSFTGHKMKQEGRFMNSLQVAGFPFAYTDLTKAWVNFGLPLHNIGVLFEAHRKNAAALTSANRVIFNGLKTLAQHQADFFKTTIGDYRKLSSDVVAGRSKEEGATNQADTTRRVYLSSVGHVRELSDIAVRANVTAVDILNARITEAFDELKAVFAAPVALTDKSSGASTEVTGEHIAISEQAGAVEEVKPEPIVMTPTRKRAAPAAKAVRRRTSRK